MSFRYTIETENPIVTDRNKMYNCRDGKLRLKIVEANPWHTGTPTEQNDYYVKFQDGGHDVLFFDDGKWYKHCYSYYSDVEFVKIPNTLTVIAWQKIKE